MRKICHIYYNTSGISGLYLNPIYEALSGEYEQTCFVNYYCPLNLRGVRKYFFKLTEKNEFNEHGFIMKHDFVRKVVRFGELKIGNKKMLKELANIKPDIINYSLTNMPDAPNMVRKLKVMFPEAKIMVTCHDVSPFHSTEGISYQSVYDVADFLLVHTENAINILYKDYHVDRSKIVFHPFPIIDLKFLEKPNDGGLKEKPRFLFIGVMREEKGVQTLIDAWNKLGRDFAADLTVAGFQPKDVKLNFTIIENFSNVDIRIRSLSDREYIECMNNSDYVLFPYSRVGNSGVLSTAVSMHKVPITTKLPTFQESAYFARSLCCEPDDADQLAALLETIVAGYHENYRNQQKKVIDQMEKEQEKFSAAVRWAYHKVRMDNGTD